MKLSNWRQLKVRSDLVISTQTNQGQLIYVVKDPITLRYFRLRPTEYAIMRMLDGETDADEIRGRLAQLGHDITDEELGKFLQQLGGANFFENVLPNQSESLYRMALLRRKHKSLWAQIKRILFIKIPLYDPDRFFSRVMPWIRFLWSRWAVAFYGVLLAAGIWTFFTNYDAAMENVSIAWLLSPERLFYFWIVFILVKTFHELGHGFTCKYFGGEVHELGILVLVLTPCLYCNITDAWIQEKHSRKFYISSAGIVVELLIAAVAALVWQATGEGFVHALAHKTMILAGITSVLFNGNPLMKFDGYYILSDVLGMPNLRGTSLSYLRQFFRKYALGLPAVGASIFVRENAIKLVYGVASQTWIFYVMFRIVRGLLTRIPPIGVWILITTVYAMVLVPVVRVAGWIARRRGRPGDVDAGRLAVLAAVAAGLAYFVFFHDIGYAVSVPCVIEPAERVMITVTTEGVLAEAPFEEGDVVGEGEVLARLENGQLELELRELEARMDYYRVQEDEADSRGEFVARESARMTRMDLQVKVEQARAHIDELVIRAPFAGVVVTPSTRSQVGAFLPKGARILELADMTKAKVTVALSENDRYFVKRGAETAITLRAYPWERFEGSVASISKAPMRHLTSGALSSKAGGGVATDPRSNRAEIPLTTTYQAKVIIVNDNPEHPLMMGMAGKAKISYGQRRIYSIAFAKFRQSIRKSFGF